MKTLARSLAPLALFVLAAPTSADAAPTMGSYLDEHLSSDTQGPNLTNTWGPRKNDGWTSLPSSWTLVGLVTDGAAYPLCATGGSTSGWVGFGRARIVGDRTNLRCTTYAEQSDTAYYFDYASPKPAPMWINTAASTPEPRGAIVLLTQEGSRRRIFACQFQKGGALFVGHIGDDGVCQGVTHTGTKDTASTYLTLVTKGTGADAQPRWGWVDASPGYSPHAPSLASVGLNLRGAVDTRALCAVSDGGQTWPGWFAHGTCEYFTYSNNATQRKTSNTYRVFRLQPGAAKAPYVFNRMGGKAYYACTSSKTINGTVVDVMFGFTNAPGTCTDGRDTTVDNRHGGWTGTKLVELPNPDANAG